MERKTVRIKVQAMPSKMAMKSANLLGGGRVSG